MTVSNNVCPYLYASIRNNSEYEKSDLVWTSSNPNVAVVDRTSGVVNPVCVGDTVEEGQVIARSGSTGKVTGPHLHFQAQVGSMCISPWYLFDGSSGVYLMQDKMS